MLSPVAEIIVCIAEVFSPYLVMPVVIWSRDRDLTIFIPESTARFVMLARAVMPAISSAENLVVASWIVSVIPANENFFDAFPKSSRPLNPSKFTDFFNSSRVAIDCATFFSKSSLLNRISTTRSSITVVMWLPPSLILQ